MEKYIYGLRAVIEAIRSGKEIDKIFIKKELSGNNFPELMELIRQNNIIVQKVPVEKLNRITRKNHQGVLAMICPISYFNLDNLILQLYEDGKLPFIVILDGITDVRNFGAIARTCECAGVDAIIIPERGSVSVGADAIKTSAGALMSLPVCRVKNLSATVRFLKDNGFHVVAASEKAEENYTKPDYSVPVAIVMGNEETGISPQVLKNCTNLVSIPQLGKIQSLNVSVAAGIMIYEVVRQRLNKGYEITL